MKRMGKKRKEACTVGEWIIEKTNTKKWRTGEMSGLKHYSHGSSADSSTDFIYDIMVAVGGRKNFLKQVAELEKKNLINVKRTSVNTDIEKITISMEQIDALYSYLKIENEKNLNVKYRRFMQEQMKKVRVTWLLDYYQELYHQLENGTIPANIRDENVLKLLDAIISLKEDVWERKLSSDVLGDSKRFKKEYKDKIVTVLKKSPQYQDAMTPDEILAEHGILTFSQTLQFKGGIVYEVEGKEIDTTPQIYGTVLNAQTLFHATLISLKNVKKVITIENQANYEDMQFEPEVLYIFTHGFFSPKERRFLEQIETLADNSISFFHWGDLDYGGIRIYQFIKQNIFSKVCALHMDASDYNKALEKYQGFEISEKKYKKLEQLEAGELEELKQCILTHKKEFEQEALL